MCADKIFKCDSITQFINSIVSILPYRGISGSKFFLCDIKGVQMLTKLSMYDKMITIEDNKSENNSSGNHNEASLLHSVDAEIKILEELRDKIIRANVSPCVIEIIYHTTCSGMSKVLPNKRQCIKYKTEPEQKIADTVYKIFCKRVDLINNGLAYDKYSYIVLERCDITLYEYMNRYISNPINFTVFKSLLFQIIYTLAAITSIFPKFRHNDLHYDNIMLLFNREYKYDAKNPKYIQLGKYYVPYFGITAKIIDFGFAVLTNEIGNLIIKNKLQMYYRPDNDILFLFNGIYHELKFATVDTLLHELDPTDSYIHMDPQLLRDNVKSIPTITDMVTCKVWDEYLTKVSDNDLFAKYNM